MPGLPLGLLGLLLPFDPIFFASVRFSRRPLACLLSPRLFSRSNSSSCALNTVESGEVTFLNYIQNLLVPRCEGFNGIPRKLLSPRDNLLVSSEIVNKSMRKKPVNLFITERLRRYSGMLRDCASTVSLNQGRTIHGHVIKCGIKPDSHLWVSLINCYAKCGSLEDARTVLDDMPERDVVSWTALVAGFVADGYGNDGVKTFCDMQKEGIIPNDFTLATGLKACSLCWNFDFGKQVHAEAIKVGYLLDLFVGSALVELYAKFGEMEMAKKVFFDMPECNVISWNSLLNGYAEMGDGEEVLKLFCSAQDSEMRFSKFTLSTVLKGCAISVNIREGQVVHSLATKIGCESDKFISCCLLDMYSKCGFTDHALKVFMMIRDPDVVAWSAIITCFSQRGESQEVAKLFHSMRLTGMSPNEFTLASLVSAAASIGDMHYAESIHGYIYKYGFETDSIVSNALVTMYMQNGRVQAGSQMFSAMTNLDSASWNALLSGFHDDKTCSRGPVIFHQMLAEGFTPNMCTFISILSSCSGLLDVGFGRQIHTHIIKNSLEGNTFVRTSLINMYTRNGCMEDAEVAFNGLVTRDPFTWTVIMAGFVRSNQVEKAVKCLGQMQQEGVKANEYVLAICLNGCSHMATVGNGRMLHSLAVKAGHAGDLFVSGALVDMYGKSGCIEDAESVFKDLISWDTVSWNIMIFAYLHHRQGEKVLETLRMMLEEGVMPDDVTLIGVICACSYVGTIEEGKRYFNSLTEVYGISTSVKHYACILDILGRAGKYSEIEGFIKEMGLTSNALIWETLLGACIRHENIEYGKRAAEKLFELEPNVDANYILLSNIFATKGWWDDVRNVRALMTNRGVKKEPAYSWLEVDGQVHAFMSRDSSHPKIRNICQNLEELMQKVTSLRSQVR